MVECGSEAWEDKRINGGGKSMPIAEKWERLKTEVQRDGERLISRATGTVLKDRIEADLAAILRISGPNNDHELTARRKIFDLLRTEWRTSVMENTRFQNKRSSG